MIKKTKEKRQNYFSNITVYRKLLIPYCRFVFTLLKNNLHIRHEFRKKTPWTSPILPLLAYVIAV